MNYSAIIVDDEPKLREVLSIKLNNYCPALQIVGKAQNAQEGYDLIIKHKPNIVFLDISMPGETGFEMLARFEKVNFEFIFVTGYNEFGLDAIKLSAIDYLLKPIKTEELINAVNKAIVKIDTDEKAYKYQTLMHNINNQGDKNSKIAIPSTLSYEFVKINDIVRCEGWQKYTKIILTNGNTIVSSYSLGTFKEILEKFEFYECHKSHLINPDHIHKYNKEGFIIMSDNIDIPISRRKKDEFIELFVTKK